MDQSRVYFLHIKAGLSQAKVLKASYIDGLLSIKFGKIHGQPEQIRFKFANNDWSEWTRFSEKMQCSLTAEPKRF